MMNEETNKGAYSVLLSFLLWWNFLCRLSSDFLGGWPFFAILLGRIRDEPDEIQDLSPFSIWVGFVLALIAAGGSSTIYAIFHAATKSKEEKANALAIMDHSYEVASSSDIEELTPSMSATSSSTSSKACVHFTGPQRPLKYIALGALCLQLAEDNEAIFTNIAEEIDLSNQNFILLLLTTATIGLIAAIPTVMTMLAKFNRYTKKQLLIEHNEEPSDLERIDNESPAMTKLKEIGNMVFVALTYLSAIFYFCTIFPSFIYVFARILDVATSNTPTVGVSSGSRLWGVGFGIPVAFATAYSQLIINQNEHRKAQEVRGNQQFFLTQACWTWMNQSAVRQKILTILEYMRLILDNIGHTADFSASGILFSDLYIGAKGPLYQEDRMQAMVRLLGMVLFYHIGSWQETISCSSAVRKNSERAATAMPPGVPYQRLAQEDDIEEDDREEEGLDDFLSVQETANITAPEPTALCFSHSRCGGR